MWSAHNYTVFREVCNFLSHWLNFKSISAEFLCMYFSRICQNKLFVSEFSILMSFFRHRKKTILGRYVSEMVIEILKIERINLWNYMGTLGNTFTNRDNTRKFRKNRSRTQLIVNFKEKVFKNERNYVFLTQVYLGNFSKSLRTSSEYCTYYSLIKIIKFTNGTPQ